MSVAATIEQRGNRYGDFGTLSRLNQRLKHLVASDPGYEQLADAQREALEMILLKVARIVNGDPDYADNWHDIAGYAKLVEDMLP